MVYKYLDLLNQSLLDQPARLEKTFGNAASNILSRVGRRQRRGNLESNKTGQVEIRQAEIIADEKIKICIAYNSTIV